MDDTWKDKLTPQQYKILHDKQTEAPFSGEHLNEKRSGMFTCAACGAELFKSDHKFDSGTGWPSFFEAADPDKIKLLDDSSHGMQRVEVTCANCGGHLGHLFDDGPTAQTGKRFCINSCSLNFNETKKQHED